MIDFEFQFVVSGLKTEQQAWAAMDWITDTLSELYDASVGGGPRPLAIGKWTRIREALRDLWWEIRHG